MKKQIFSFIFSLTVVHLTTFKVQADPVAPESANLEGRWELEETGPPNAPINVFYTNDGDRIKNSNGQEVKAVGRLGSINGKTTFIIPGFVNGLAVTDVEQETGDPGDPEDPGTLQLSVFTNGIMTSDPISNWLVDNNFIGSNSIVMPDFFPVGFDEVFYGVDLSEINNLGEEFVESFDFGDTFTINDFGIIPELPMYKFSETRLNYVPGIGWEGTPLVSGTEVEFIAFHEASVPVPEKYSTLTTFIIFTFGTSLILKEKINSKNRV